MYGSRRSSWPGINGQRIINAEGGGCRVRFSSSAVYGRVSGPASPVDPPALPHFAPPFLFFCWAVSRVPSGCRAAEFSLLSCCSPCRFPLSSPFFCIALWMLVILLLAIVVFLVPICDSVVHCLVRVLWCTRLERRLWCFPCVGEYGALRELFVAGIFVTELRRYSSAIFYANLDCGKPSSSISLGSFQ